MTTRGLMGPILLQVAWTALLYVALTAARAAPVWGIGRRADGSNPLGRYEPRISANLRNQFEWPVLFYVVCLLLLRVPAGSMHPAQCALAWLFVAGRVLHSAVQILTSNVRWRGAVFMINFLAVLAMWALLALQA